MFKKLILFIIINLCLSVAYSGDFYKCLNEKGQTVFSDKKCAENAEKFNIKEEKDYENSTYSSGSGTYSGSVPSSSTSYSRSRVIHTGPRGGKYYYNSSGNKTYIKRK